MKKFIYILAMAMAVVMTACDNDFAYPPVIMGEIKGSGTAQDPYNIAKAIRVCAQNGETSDEFVFVEGYVVSGEIDTSYGNATFNLGDSPDATQILIAYRIKGYNNQKFTDPAQIKVGDKIVLYTPLINFRGNTPETGTGAYVYSINGNVGSNILDQPQGPSVTIEAKGSGTAADPYNVAKALEVAKANGETSDVSVYTEGYVISGSIDTSYGNGTWVISDNPEGTASQITVYRAKDIDNAKFTDAGKIKPGDKIVVYAPLINFKGNTPETNLGYLYSINGSAGDTPSTPETPATGTAKFRKAAAVTSGKQYLIVADGKAATPLTKDYGYLNMASYAVSGDEVEAPLTDAFTFTADGAGYTITAAGKYYYQTGTYNSFNVSETRPDEGALWTVDVNDGKFVITNISVSKSVQYDPQYSSFGSYPDVRGEYPVLYEKVG